MINMPYVRPSPLYPKNWNRLRFYIFDRDNYICQICGKKCDGLTPSRKPECDHIRPISRGGTHHPNNLQCLCSSCHRKKSLEE